MGGPWVPLSGITFLGLIGLVCTVASAIIIIDGHEVPPFIAGMGGGAVSTLGTVIVALTMSRRSNGANPS